MNNVNLGYGNSEEKDKLSVRKKIPEGISQKGKCSHTKQKFSSTHIAPLPLKWAFKMGIGFSNEDHISAMNNWQLVVKQKTVRHHDADTYHNTIAQATPRIGEHRAPRHWSTESTRWPTIRWEKYQQRSFRCFMSNWHLHRLTIEPTEQCISLSRGIIGTLPPTGENHLNTTVGTPPISQAWRTNIRDDLHILQEFDKCDTDPTCTTR